MTFSLNNPDTTNTSRDLGAMFENSMKRSTELLSRGDPVGALQVCFLESRWEAVGHLTDHAMHWDFKRMK
jgi:hypothetical protein